MFAAHNQISITVRLHAILSNLLASKGGAPIQVSLPVDALVADVVPALGLPPMEMVFALNGKVVQAHSPLSDGDHLDIIPAISGGGKREV